jgi:hypothetical protein
VLCCGCCWVAWLCLWFARWLEIGDWRYGARRTSHVTCHMTHDSHSFNFTVAVLSSYNQLLQYACIIKFKVISPFHTKTTPIIWGNCQQLRATQQTSEANCTQVAPASESDRDRPKQAKSRHPCVSHTHTNKHTHTCTQTHTGHTTHTHNHTITHTTTRACLVHSVKFVCCSFIPLPQLREF